MINKEKQKSKIKKKVYEITGVIKCIKGIFCPCHPLPEGRECDKCHFYVGGGEFHPCTNKKGHCHLDYHVSPKSEEGKYPPLSNKDYSLEVAKPKSDGWEEEFENNRPKTDIELLDAKNPEAKSKIYKFGYKHRNGGEIYEVTDWGNIKSFISNLLIKEREDERQRAKDIVIGKIKDIDKTIVGYTRPIDERNRTRKLLNDILEDFITNKIERR